MASLLYSRMRTWKMSQTIQLLPAGFDSLSVEEQIDYLQSLWERIAAQPEQVPVTRLAHRGAGRQVSSSN